MSTLGLVQNDVYKFNEIIGQKEQCPYDLETIAGLQNMSALLSKRGYSNDDI
jgi:hypothetical protein